MTSEQTIVSRHWSQSEPVRDAGGFYSSPIIRPYIISMAYGDQFVARHAANPYYAEDLFIEHHLKRHTVRSVLSL